MRWGLLATGVGKTPILFTGKFSLSLFSTTLFSNLNCHNHVVQTAGCRAAFLLSSKHPFGLCQTSCLQLGHVTGLRLISDWRRPGLCSSFGRFSKLFSYCYNCLLYPLSFLIVAAISALLLVRVVRFVTNSSRTAFSFVATAARLSKYPSRAARSIG